MAGDHQSSLAPVPVLDGNGLKVAIIAARWNSEITMRLLDGARRGLSAAGVDPADVIEDWVPGAFELPLAARTWAVSGRVDAVICLGCVIRGETTHYEVVAGECARGIQDVQLATGVPVAFGALTVENLDQALARSEDVGGHSVGEDGANVADHATLTTLAAEVGLDADAAAEVLAADRYRDMVLADLQGALDREITGVPGFLIEDRLLIPGAQEPETFVNVLNRVRERLLRQG